MASAPARSLTSSVWSAVAVMRKVLAQDPGNVKVAYGLAGTLIAVGDHQQAIQVYREIVRRNPREFGAYVNLGQERLKCPLVGSPS